MAFSAHGTLFQLGDGGEPEVFTTIPEVRDIKDLGSSAEVEHLYGDGDIYPTVVPTRVEPGEVTFDINYTGHDTHAVLRRASTDQARLSIRIVFPTDPVETLAFSGYVTEFLFFAPVEGIMLASVTITLASDMATVEAEP